MDFDVFHSPSDMSPVDPGNSESERLNESSPGFSDSTSGARSHLSFGLYEFNLQTHELLKGGLRLKIPHQSFQILAMLLERPGEVVSREDLRRKLWPSDVFVNFEASLNSAMQRLRSALQDNPLEPRYIETLPRVGYRFIASVELLVAVSDEAPESAATLESAEIPLVDTAPDEFSAVPRGKRRNWPNWAAAVLPLLLFVAYAEYRHSHRDQPVPKAQAQPSLVIPSVLIRRSVAVMGFTNVSGYVRDVWLSTAFTEMLATELAAGDQLRTVDAEDVTRAKHELSLANEDSYAVHTLTKIHKNLGCDYVVAGSYLAIGKAGGGRVRLDARVQDAVTGETVASFAVVGFQSDLFDLVSHAGEQLRAKLGVGALTSTEAEEVKLALPSNAEAARLYSDGLAKLRLYDDVAAGDLLERVIRLQPEYSPAYSALATAWSDLGYDAKAAVAARKAMDLAQNLPQQARLQTEARHHEMNGDWTQAIEAYSRLQRSYPDNLDYGLNLAAAQDAMGKSTEAAATLAALRKPPSPERDDPRIDITEARIAGNLGDYKRAQTLANSAVRKAEITGAGLLLARAKLIEGYASFFLGNLSSAVDADAVAQRMFAESGDVDRSAVASMNIGGVLATQGDIIGAKHSIEQALNVFRKQGDQARLAAALSNLGEMYRIEGDLPRAENLFREAVTVSTKLNGVRDVETYNLADLLQRRGKFREAKGMLEPLVERLRSEGNKSVLGAALQTLGSIAETQGDMATALGMYQDAVARLKETGVKTDYTAAERSLGKAFLREGDFVSAKQALSEALSLDRETGAKTDTALDQVELAELSLAQAGPVDTGTLRSVIDEFRLQKITDGEIEAEIVLAREIIQQGKTAEAAKMLEQTTVLSAKSYDPTVRFDVALADAHVRAAQHRFDDARRVMRPALEKAVAVGCLRCKLEARLELGEIEIGAGNAERGRAQLHELGDEARRKGFGLIAERATADSIRAAVVPERPTEKHSIPR
jgi:DNA-binding winged helix-turn-helix (wHTH) protein/tetratricopeptide (TPR) repeat protein/TolB-like protein